MICCFSMVFSQENTYSSEKEEKDNQTTGYSLLNSLVGFGIGSYVQGDKKSGGILLTTDLVGFTVLGVGIAGSIVVDYGIDLMRAFYGNVTQVDKWIFSGVIATGAVILFCGRIFGIYLPTKFEGKNITVKPELAFTDSSFYTGVKIYF